MTTTALSDLTLVVRRKIKADPTRVFAAWTRPEHLVKWWGPAGVSCPVAEVDLRVGGRYRLANQLPGGRVLDIEGEFVVIRAPHELVYTWRLGPGLPERVTVLFEAREDGTEVTVKHERIANQAAYDDHEHGWLGCLDGLAELVEPST